MFVVALILGLYSYLIFSFGLFGLFYKNIIVSFSIIYLLIASLFIFKLNTINIDFSKIKFSKLSKIFILLILLQVLVNLIGALGPELSFDALWYHLSIPKIYLENHKIFHISGNLLYYSDLPKSIEMFYVSSLSFSNEIFAKLIHFSFGLLSIFALYKLSKKFLNQEFSLLSCVIFYSGLIVGWQSITAYVDLGRTFFEIVALYQFVLWIDKKKFKYLIYSGVLIGFSLSSKVAAFNSVAIFSLLILFYDIYAKSSIKKTLINIGSFILASVLIPLPYFIFSYLNTGNPIYPIFNTNFNLDFDWHPFNIFRLFLFSQDPINPMYLIVLPIVIFLYRRFNLKNKILFYYVFLSLVFWLATSSFGGSRFILPYLPAFSILVAVSIDILNNSLLKKYLLFLVIIISLSSAEYRFLANYKYIPVILGFQEKNEFLTHNLNFSFGDFYDTDEYFKNHIKTTDKVLLYGFHNLYYVNFPYIDSSWVKKGDRFNYIAVQNSNLPERFLDWKEIYYNSLTKVKLYAKEGKQWVY